MHTSKGKLRYFSYDSGKLILEIDKNIVDYYYSLIPPWLPKQRQKFFAKITVVRTNVEKPNLKYWYKYQGEIVDFNYSGIIHEDNNYYFLQAYSTRLNNIRMELGLPAYRKPWKHFHITIANRKHV